MRDKSTGERVRTAIRDPAIGQATHILVGAEHDLLVVDWSHSQIVAYDLDTGARLGRRAGPGLLEHPISAAIDGDTLWVLDERGMHAFDPITWEHLDYVWGEGRLDSARNLIVVR